MEVPKGPQRRPGYSLLFGRTDHRGWQLERRARPPTPMLARKEEKPLETPTAKVAVKEEPLEAPEKKAAAAAAAAAARGEPTLQTLRARYKRIREEETLRREEE